MGDKDKGALGENPSPQPQPCKGQPDHKPGDDQPNDPAKTPPDMGNDDEGAACSWRLIQTTSFANSAENLGSPPLATRSPAARLKSVVVLDQRVEKRVMVADADIVSCTEDSSRASLPYDRKQLHVLS